MKISGKPKKDLVKLTKDMCKSLGVNLDFNLVFTDRKQALEHYGKIRGVPRVPPAYMYFSEEGPVLVLIPEVMDEHRKKGDTYEAQLFDEILHFRCLQEGWMDVAIAAYKEAEQYFERISVLSLRELDRRFLGQIQRHVTNFIGEEMAVRLGYKEKILTERKRLLKVGAEFVSQHQEEFKIPHSFAPISHSFMCAFLVTLPPSYSGREEIEDKKLIPKAEPIIHALRSDIQEKFGEIKDLVSSIQSPPNEDNLFEIYKKAIQIYAALA